MNTVTIGKDGNEREVTQEEFVELNAVNDELTDFLATKQDLFTIVDALLKHIPDTTYWLHLCVSSS